MMTERGMDILERHEGYRADIYLDTEGNPTGGIGHHFAVGSTLPDHIWRKIFWNDVYVAHQEYEKLGIDLDDARRDVLVNMIFNMGLPTLLKFKRFLAAVRRGDWGAARLEMLDSRWARQVGNRALELAEMMKTGEYPPEGA